MKNELRETVRSITPKFIVFFIVGSVTLSMLTITTYIDWASGFGAALLAISRSASIFALGAPFVIGAALLLPSFYKSKGSTIVSYEKFDERFLTISRFLVLLILSSIFMISWTLLSYSYAMQEYLHVSPDLILAYLPGTIISGLIITTILSAITTFIATVVDDWKIALIANLGLFYILGISFGSTSGLNSFDTLAIYGPYHLYRFLSLFLSSSVVDPVFGTVWGDPTMMNMIVGINFGATETLFSLGCWITLSIVMLLLTQYLMKQNISRQRIENDLDRFTPDDQKLLAKMKESKKFLKQRRLVLGTLLVIMLIVLPLFRFSLRLATIDDSMTTLYESPSGGELLTLGSWTYGEVEIPPPPDGLNNMYQLRVEILDWGNCPDVIERHEIFAQISLSDFVALNDTEKDSMIMGGNLDIRSDRTVVGSGFCAIQTTGPHLWAFKFVPAEGYPLQGMLHIRITLIIRAS